MNQNDFLLLNAGVVTLVVLYFMVMRRKPDQPVRLRLQDRDSKAPVSYDPAKAQQAKATPGAQQTSQASAGSTARPSSPPPPAPKRSAERVLNISFTHDDGRIYDAFEVLQIPAGSSAQAALIAYNTLIQVTKPEQLPLLKAALAAIQKT